MDIRLSHCLDWELVLSTPPYVLEQVYSHIVALKSSRGLSDFIDVFLMNVVGSRFCIAYHNLKSS